MKKLKILTRREYVEMNEIDAIDTTCIGGVRGCPHSCGRGLTSYFRPKYSLQTFCANADKEMCTKCWNEPARTMDGIYKVIIVKE